MEVERVFRRGRGRSDYDVGLGGQHVCATRFGVLMGSRLTSKGVFFLRRVVLSPVDDIPLAVLAVRLRLVSSDCNPRLRVKPSSTGSRMTTFVFDILRRVVSSSIDVESDDVMFFKEGRMGRVSDGMLSVADLCCAASDDGPGPAWLDAGKFCVVGVEAEEAGAELMFGGALLGGSAKTLRGLRLFA